MSFEDLKVESLVDIEDEKATVTRSSTYPSHPSNGLVKFGEKKWIMPIKYAKEGDKLYNFEVRPDDTWILPYPRSGTTMTMELVWLVANNLNFDEANQRNLFERVPYIDISVMLDEHRFLSSPAEEKIDKYSIEYVRDLPSPRFIKSHMPLDLLPRVANSDCRIIYVARNPKDVVVSWYNFNKHYKYFQYKGTFELFCNMFINNKVLWNPYWEHVKAAWAIKHKPNVLFLFYEDLKKDLLGTIKKVAAFYDKTYSEEQLAKLMEHLNIENFRKNAMVNQIGPGSLMTPEQFIRQGKIGSWKETFTPEMEEKFDKWIADNLKNTDLNFSSYTCCEKNMI